MAKELLYKEIEEKSGFEYKLGDGSIYFKRLITRDDYRSECVLMEFPTIEGYYPDEFGCQYTHKHTCGDCIWNDDCGFFHSYTPENECGGYVWIKNVGCKITKQNGFRFNIGDGYCKCSSCEHYNFKGSAVHDIAVFWKGNVRWAIEIVNKHPPKWDILRSSMPYEIFIVNAEDVLKRVDKTPVYVPQIRYTEYPL